MLEFGFKSRLLPQMKMHVDLNWNVSRKSSFSSRLGKHFPTLFQMIVDGSTIENLCNVVYQHHP